MVYPYHPSYVLRFKRKQIEFSVSLDNAINLAAGMAGMEGLLQTDYFTTEYGATINRGPTVRRRPGRCVHQRRRDLPSTSSNVVSGTLANAPHPSISTVDLGNRPGEVTSGQNPVLIAHSQPEASRYTPETDDTVSQPPWSGREVSRLARIVVFFTMLSTIVYLIWPVIVVWIY